MYSTTSNVSTETAGANSTGIFECKATNANATTTAIAGGYSGTDCIEMRYAEVLLNLAESAVGIDRIGADQEAYTYLKAIRARAGIALGSDNLYGLTANMQRDPLFAAILHECQVEFAFEGKRFWDLRRWMLFGESTAINDNTNTRLNIPVLNGTRRHGMAIEVKKSAYTGSNDPLLATRDAANIDVLYDTYFTVAEKDVDAEAPFVFTWFDIYYFFGIHTKTLNASPYLQ